VLRFDDDRLLVALGDVSGKGIPAALFMAVTMTLLRGLARQYREPDEILRRVNDLLAPGQPPGLVLSSSGRVLGLLPDNDLAAQSLTLEPGQTLVLFTDGVSEAYDPDQALFGEERLLAHLESRPGRDARETTLGVLEAVRSHAAGAKQSDDITVVSVRRTR
jgi:sigma-B regulation protein RsbU (phosphoserine phosphatase)